MWSKEWVRHPKSVPLHQSAGAWDLLYQGPVPPCQLWTPVEAHSQRLLRAVAAPQTYSGGSVVLEAQNPVPSEGPTECGVLAHSFHATQSTNGASQDCAGTLPHFLHTEFFNMPTYKVQGPHV